MSKETELHRLLQSSIDLHLQAVETMRKMQRLALLADLLGRDLKSITEPVSTYHVHGQFAWEPWHNAALVVTVKGEQPRTFPIEDVHYGLWPDDWAERHKRATDKAARNAARRRAQEGGYAGLTTHNGEDQQ